MMDGIDATSIAGGTSYNRKLQVWEYFWIVYLMGNGGAWNGSWFVGQMFLELEEILGNCLATLFGSVWPLLEEEVP